MKKIIILLVIAFCISSFSFCQSVGIGTTIPNNSAQLDITSSAKGILIPRMNTETITSISNPAKALMVYDSSKNQLMVNMGTALAPDWQTVVSKSGWNLTGNSGTNAATNFLGTTDASPLIMKVDNFKSGLIGSGTFNTGLGFRTLDLITTGEYNASFGYKALTNNSIGNLNTGIGFESLFQNTTGSWNTGIGYSALHNNLSGGLNTAVGYDALYYIISGGGNTSLGAYSLYHNDDSYNTAIGYGALATTTSSQYNTAVGSFAGYSFELGYNNTFLGANCGVNVNGLYNCVAIGQGVTCTANSQARIGNSATNSIGGYANWTNISDGRYKKNVQENVKGIDFIMKLHPVTYQLDVQRISNKLDESRGREMDKQTKQSIVEKEKIIFSGFVAQEVEAAAKESGYDFSGVDAPKNENDFYGLRYGDFVVPLVKAVQEQQVIINTQQLNINDLQKKLQSLEDQVKLLLQASNHKN